MNTPLEIFVKVAVLAVLVLSGIALWILPKTRFAGRIRGGEKSFITSQWLGVLTGTAGLAATFILPRLIVEAHLMWLILLPFVLAEMYWLLVARVRRTASVLDEKQDLDMTRSGALTLGLSVPAMTLFFLWSRDRFVEPFLWLPFFLFTVVLVFSGGVLIGYRRS
jgi:hypothetical protein